MINLQDQNSLEEFFSENLNTPLFPVLAELYFNHGNYGHSRKVCEIGLKTHPHSGEGNYIMAKLELLEDNLVNAEKRLLKTIKYNSVHLIAMYMLLAVQEDLGRSKKTILTTAQKILAIDDKDEKCKKLLEIKKSNLKEKPQTKSKTKNEKEQTTSNKNVIPQTLDIIDTTKKDNKINSISINKQLASVTLAQVYKKQGFFEQSLLILNMVKEKKPKNKDVVKEIKIIKNMIKERDLNE